MTSQQFRASLTESTPPPGLSAALAALWWDGKNDWHKAHDAAQQGEGEQACDWVHAYLHRKEGDAFNAGYWYRRACKPMYEGALEDEWTALLTVLIM